MMYGHFRSLYYALLIVSMLLIVWLLAGCAAPDMGRQEAIDIVKLERVVR